MKPSFSFKDITTYFNISSNCCNKGQSSANLARRQEREDSLPCRNSARLPDSLKEYIIKRSHGTKNFVHNTTITIGRKWIGKLSAKEQYTIMKRDIKRHIPYRSEQKYVYTFEFQANGQLHAHGVELGTTQGKFIEDFSHYGRRNMHNKSYETLRNVSGYLEYIDKEHAFPYITNIHKKEIKEYSHAQPNQEKPGESEGGAAGAIRDVAPHERERLTPECLEAQRADATTGGR